MAEATTPMGSGGDSGRMSLSATGCRPLDGIDRLARRPWFSYLTLLLLQLKVMWGV